MKMTVKYGLFLLTFLPSIAQPITANADTWIKDPETDCKIWSPDPMQPGDKVSWTGGCLGGLASGPGTASVTNDGVELGVYDGTLVDGKFDGAGVLKLRKGKDDKFIEVRSSFKNGLAQGYGEIDNPNGSSYQGDFDAGEFDGSGIYVAANGDRYEGQFKDGEPHGLGHFIAKDGEEYQGDFLGGKRFGLGIHISSTGGIYVGEFKDGLPSGSGMFEDKQGGRYHGQFAMGKPNGFGTYVAGDDATWQGFFVNGVPDGIALMSKDGDAKVQTWRNGKVAK
ncbi:MAG: MORN repeat-containing protein [Woeseiaceae bacterium]